MADVSQLKARFEKTQKPTPPTKPTGARSKGKPTPSKKPLLPLQPRPLGKKVSKVGSSLVKNTPGGVLTGTEHHMEPGITPKRTSMLPPSSTSQDVSMTLDSPGLGALAQCSPTSSRRTPPPPPTKPHSSSHQGSPRRNSPQSSPHPDSPTSLCEPEKQVVRPVIGRLGQMGKACSMDSEPQMGKETGGRSTKRPHSVSVDDLDGVAPIRRSSPVLGNRHRSALLRHSTGVSRSYENALDSPITMESPTIPRANTAILPKSPLVSSPQSQASSSPSPHGTPEDRDGKWPESKPRVSSLPRNTQLSVSPPPVDSESKEGKRRSASDVELREDNSTAREYKTRPKSEMKPPLGPKPKVPRKPPSLSNLMINHPRSRSSSREVTPDPQVLPKDDSSVDSSKSPPGSEVQSPDLGPPAVVVRTETGTTIYRDGDSSSKRVKPETHPSTERVEPKDRKEEDEKSPRSPPSDINRLSPTVSPRHRKAEPEPVPAAVESRGNVDSGFISEPPDDLVLLRKESVGSATSEEKGAGSARSSGVWDEARLEKARKKRRNIAEELLQTEKTYLDRVKVVAVDFYGSVDQFNTKSNKVIPAADVRQIFLNIQQIHQLNENFLQDLQTCMDSWSTREGLGIVIARVAPFLKIYSEYTAGFEDAMKTLTLWTTKDKKFDILVREFEREVISTGLGVAHLMLEPVQRIPRYRLLVADYLKYLPEDSPDRPPTEKALAIISEAADRTNNKIKELENYNEILSIQRSLQDYDSSLIVPSRIFLKKGMMQKFSRKTLTPRMFFLFSDVLLHTYVSGGGIYKFKNEMPIFGMQVSEPKVSLVPHSFEVYSTTRSLILAAESEEEKQEWIDVLTAAINDDLKKRSSLRRDSFLTKNEEEEKEFGMKAPIMVPDKSVTMCQTCTSPFTFTFRRHHCRACGKVVCSNCSQWKAYLQYMQKVERICEDCFQISQATAEGTETADGPPSPKTPKKHEGGVLDLKAFSEDAVVTGYVNWQEGKNKWTRMWYQVKRDSVLYRFRAHEDVKAVNSMPLPGYRILADKGTSTISLIHASGKKQLCDTFRVDSPDEFDYWVEVLEKAARMELPDLLTPMSNTSVSTSGWKRRSQSSADSHHSTPEHQRPKSVGDATIGGLGESL